RLYFRNEDQKVFLVKTTEGDLTSFDLIDPVSLNDAGAEPPDKLTKIGTNNGLRRVLRTTVARFGLSSPDASVRLEAVHDILRSLDETNVELLRERKSLEDRKRTRLNSSHLGISYAVFCLKK